MPPLLDYQNESAKSQASALKRYIFRYVIAFAICCSLNVQSTLFDELVRRGQNSANIETVGF